MAYVNPKESTLAFKQLAARQGGGFLLHKKATYPEDSISYATPLKRPDGYKAFSISVYNSEEDIDELTLTLILNPADLQIGQVFLAKDSYTRRGWLPTLWGIQQPTLSANGKTSAFYVNGGLGGSVGMTNYNRKNSLSYINFLSLIGIYKNNGSYFLEEIVHQSYFGDRTSRVIDVMDSVKISYDGSDYVGTFNTFTLDEDAENPYSISYNFEFVISGIRGDKISGHVRVPGVKVGGIVIGDQGYNTYFSETITMDEEELNADFKIKKKDFTGVFDWNQTAAEKSRTEGRLKSVGSILPEDQKTVSGMVDSFTSLGLKPSRVPGDARNQLTYIRKFNETNNTENLLKSMNEELGGIPIKQKHMNAILFMEGQFERDTKNPKSFFVTSPDGAKGFTQIIEDTYGDIASRSDFKSFMRTQGYTDQQVEKAYQSGLLERDAKFGYLAGAFYAKEYVLPVMNKNNLGDDTRLLGYGYNGGPGKLRPSTLPRTIVYESANYVTNLDTYKEYIEDDEKSISELK